MTRLPLEAGDCDQSPASLFSEIGQLRSRLRLVERNTRSFHPSLRTYIRDILVRLDNIKSIYPPLIRPHERAFLRSNGLDLDVPFRELVHSERRPARQPPDDLVRWSDELQASARAMSWSFRVAEEYRQRVVNDGWFPLLITLTVDPALVAAAGFDDLASLWADDRSWNRFQKVAQSLVRSTITGTRSRRAWLPVADYWRHFAVLEHGKSGHHHHVHALVFLRDIPSRWKVDPNAGRATPNRHEIDAAEGDLSVAWPWGRVTVNGYFAHGSWFLKNWVVPIGRKVGGPEATAGYLVKYLTKGSKQWRHRIKVSRGYGLQRLDDLLVTTPVPRLISLSLPASRYETASLLASATSVPPLLVRSRARRELFRRCMTSTSRFLRSSLKTWAMRDLWHTPWAIWSNEVAAGARPSGLAGKALWAFMRLADIPSTVGAAARSDVRQAEAWAPLLDLFPRERVTLSFVPLSIPET